MSTALKIVISFVLGGLWAFYSLILTLLSAFGGSKNPWTSYTILLPHTLSLSLRKLLFIPQSTFNDLVFMMFIPALIAMITLFCLIQIASFIFTTLKSSKTRA